MQVQCFLRAALLLPPTHTAASTTTLPPHILSAPEVHYKLNNKLYPSDQTPAFIAHFSEGTTNLEAKDKGTCRPALKGGNAHIFTNKPSGDLPTSAVIPASWGLLLLFSQERRDQPPLYTLVRLNLKDKLLCSIMESFFFPAALLITLACSCFGIPESLLSSSAL